MDTVPQLSIAPPAQVARLAIALLFKNKTSRKTTMLFRQYHEKL